MEKFLLIIFWLILGLYLFRLAFRYLIPWFVARYIKKMTERMQQNHGNAKKNDENDGLNINYHQKKEPIIDPEIGEYVDFEEIKDNESSKKND